MSLQRILVEGRTFVLERSRSWQSPFSTDDTARGFAVSHALICPRCLTRWAVLHFEGDEDIYARSQYCAKHGGGALMGKWSFDPELLRSLPKELLMREFSLTLKEMKL